jgi:hypothetical protein
MRDRKLFSLVVGACLFLLVSCARDVFSVFSNAMGVFAQWAVLFLFVSSGMAVLVCVGLCCFGGVILASSARLSVLFRNYSCVCYSYFGCVGLCWSVMLWVCSFNARCICFVCL